VYKIRNKGLIPYYLVIDCLKSQFKKFTLHKIDRRFNSRANNLALKGSHLY